MHPQSIHSRTPTLFLRVAFLAVLALFAVGLQQADGQTFSSLHSFSGPDNGNYPVAALMQGSDGAFYGTTEYGGAYNDGTVFKVNADGTGFVTLHTFNGSDGQSPTSAIIQGRDGALYGTTSILYGTSFAGISGSGTVYKINPDGTGFQTLHLFNGNVTYGALIQGRDGALYGTTWAGGAYSGGTVFKVNTDGTGFATLYSFSGNDGIFPEAGVLQGSDGALYGTTYGGGANGAGTVFKVNADGTGFATLYNFSGSDGANPEAALIQGRDGILYGTTLLGGASNDGTVFKVNTDGTGFQTLSSFSGRNGANPDSALIQGPDNALYGTTDGDGLSNAGTVFKVNTDGTGFQILHTFSGRDGGFPYAAVIQGRDGLLYGTTGSGGAYSEGTVFKINTDGTGFATLYSFSGSDGANPEAALIQGRDGTLYGTTEYGGAYSVGTVFKVNTDGTGFQNLYSFSSEDGAYPQAALVQGRDGALYGTTGSGGAYNVGTVFKINTDGTGFQTLYSFSGSDGANPEAALIQALDGTLYGTTQQGGTYSDGTVFKVNTDGTGFATLHTFNGRDGAGPVSAVIQGRDNALYGTTEEGGIYSSGTVFKLNTDGTGFQPLHSFSVNQRDGANPQAGVLQALDGALYGATSYGGASNDGTLFKINTDGTGFATLYTFSGTDGDNPQAALIQGQDGLLYGTTSYGGASGDGTVFKVNTDGTGFQNLSSFSFNRAVNTLPALIQGNDGTLYGTTEYGGEYGFGTVFALRLFTDVTAEVQVSSSELIYNRVTRRYTGTLTIKNNSNTLIAGPIQAALSHLPAGVTLVNTNGTYNGAPYVTANITSLPPRGLLHLPLQFSVTSGSQRIGYSIKVYSGTP